MIRFVMFLTFLLVSRMAYDAVDSALAPYEAAFYQVGGPVVFLALLFTALYQRRVAGRNEQPQGTSLTLQE